MEGEDEVEVISEVNTQSHECEDGEHAPKGGRVHVSPLQFEGEGLTVDVD